MRYLWEKLCEARSILMLPISPDSNEVQQFARALHECGLGMKIQSGIDDVEISRNLEIIDNALADVEISMEGVSPASFIRTVQRLSLDQRIELASAIDEAANLLTQQLTR